MNTPTPIVQLQEQWREQFRQEHIEQWRKALEEEAKWWANEKRKQLAIELAAVLKG